MKVLQKKISNVEQQKSRLEDSQVDEAIEICDEEREEEDSCKVQISIKLQQKRSLK